MNTVPERAGPQVLTQEYVGTRAVSPPPGRALPRSVVLQVAGLALGIIGLAFLLIKFGLAFRSLGAWGYVGVAAVEFANCAMLIFPTPAPAYTFAMGAILNPIAVGFVGGTFATLGEMVSYYLGRKGSAILPDGPDGQTFQCVDRQVGRRRTLRIRRSPGPVRHRGDLGRRGPLPPRPVRADYLCRQDHQGHLDSARRLLRT